MDFLNRRQALSTDALWKFTDLSTSVQKHLEQVSSCQSLSSCTAVPASTSVCAVQVYLTLAALVLVAAGGVAVQSILHIPPLVCMVRPDKIEAADAHGSHCLRHLLSLQIGFAACSYFLASTPNNPKKMRKRCAHCVSLSYGAEKKGPHESSQYCTDQAGRLTSGSAKAG